MQFFAFNLEKFTPNRLFFHRHRLWCLWQIWGMQVWGFGTFKDPPYEPRLPSLGLTVQCSGDRVGGDMYVFGNMLCAWLSWHIAVLCSLDVWVGNIAQAVLSKFFCFQKVFYIKCFQEYLLIKCFQNFLYQIYSEVFFCIKCFQKVFVSNIFRSFLYQMFSEGFGTKCFQKNIVSNVFISFLYQMFSEVVHIKFQG